MDNKKSDSFLAREINARNLLDGVLAVSPNLALYFWTGSPVWFHGALVTMCLLIVQTRLGHSLALLCTHAVTMAALTALFYLTVPSTYAFAIIVVATGFATLWIMRLDSRLESFGNWNFIPPLYIACDMASTARGPERIEGLLQLLAVWPVSILCVAIVLRPPLFVRNKAGGDKWHHWFGLSALDPKPRSVGEVYRAAGARAIAVLLATALMEWEGVGNGEWGIWSSASIANADSGKAVDKFKDRAIGAIGGVSLGLLLGPWLPHSPVLYVVVVLGMFLTLTVPRRYGVGFFLRCFLVTMAAFAAAQGMEAGRERAMNVMTGSIIGLLVTLAFRFVPKKRGA